MRIGLPRTSRRPVAAGERLRVSEDQHRTLLLVSGLLQAITKQCGISETARWTIRRSCDDTIIAEVTIGEALDMADRALDPIASAARLCTRPG